MTTKQGRPAFVGERWLRPDKGYAYESPIPPAFDSRAAMRSDDGWVRLLGIFECAKAGDGSGLAQLPGIISASDDPYLSSAAINLLGAAGRESLLPALVPLMEHRIYDIRLDAYAAADLSGALLFIEPLLEAHAKHLSGERGMIENSLSHLLEPEADLIAEPMQMPLADYDVLVRRTAQAVEKSTGPGVPVFEGQPLNVERIVKRVLALVSSPELGEYIGTVMDLMHRFETLTGTPCVGLFEESGQPLPLNIRLTLERFVQGGGLSRFPPGRRFFFGHPVAGA